jgi:hypothetical protein
MVETSVSEPALAPNGELYTLHESKPGNRWPSGYVYAHGRRVYGTFAVPEWSPAHDRWVRVFHPRGKWAYSLEATSTASVQLPLASTLTFELPRFSPGRPLDLDEVIEAWPAVLGLLKAPLRAGIQDAQPIALESGIIVFGVPTRRFDAINERFRKEAAAIKEAFAARLGAAR